MSDLDFYAHVATRSDVLGAGAGTDFGPEDWEKAVGPGYLDVPGGGSLRREYGLVTVNFLPDSRGRMSCFGFGVKVHRLMHDRSPDTVPPALSRRYGTFAPRARFEELRNAVLALGHTVELEDETIDMNRYRVSDSGTRIFVITDPDPYGDGDHDLDDPDEQQVGDIWSLDISPTWWEPR
ncbi:hypothetical protein [Embleya sp. NBC_00896]|uniref:hypothetical protein n=1 Tax=Embleya sp. NBC_00896 TaxID=2975961 RepID=UPI002F912468|nr:hypothetical protein OG928_42835 [Embleya sp. NBC_00896]